MEKKKFKNTQSRLDDETRAVKDGEGVTRKVDNGIIFGLETGSQRLRGKENMKNGS